MGWAGRHVIDYMLAKRIVLYAVALLLAFLCAVALEIPRVNGAKRHLRLAFWPVAGVWAALLLAGVLRACSVSLFDMLITIAAVVSITCNVLFLVPIFKNRKSE